MSGRAAIQNGEGRLGVKVYDLALYWLVLNMLYVGVVFPFLTLIYLGPYTKSGESATAGRS